MKVAHFNLELQPRRKLIIRVSRFSIQNAIYYFWTDVATWQVLLITLTKGGLVSHDTISIRTLKLKQLNGFHPLFILLFTPVLFRLWVNSQYGKWVFCSLMWHHFGAKLFIYNKYY